MDLLKRIGPYDILAVSEQTAVGRVERKPPTLQIDQDDQIGSILRDQAERASVSRRFFRHLRGEL